jgi:heme-degrading monooxygenase HmoA
MIAVIFESWPQEIHQKTYEDMIVQLRVELQKIKGFISIEKYVSASHAGKVLSLSFFEDEDSVTQWRNIALHRLAQTHGRQKFYSDYRIRVATVTRDYSMTERAQAPSDSTQYHHS